MTLFTVLTMPARNGGVNRHPPAIFCYARKFMPQHQRAFQPGIANALFRKPVQVRAAYADGGNAQQPFAKPGGRARLIVQAQVMGSVQTKDNHQPIPPTLTINAGYEDQLYDFSV
jgi:hypothetical protein